MLWSSRLFWRVFALFAILDALLIFAVVLLVRWHYRATLVDRESRSLIQTLTLLESRLPKDWVELPDEQLRVWTETQREQTGIALTLYDEAGHRRASSDVEAETRIGEWPELLQARSQGKGQSERSSPGSGRRLYVAKVVPGRDGESQGVLCSSTGLEHIAGPVGQLERTLMGGGTLFAIVGAGLGFALIRRSIRPLAQLTRGTRMTPAGPNATPDKSDELGQIGHAFEKMRSELDTRVDQLNANSERLKAVLENMVEGVLAVNPAEQILLANEASRELLEIPPGTIDGRPLLEVTRSLAVHNAVVAALADSHPVQREFESTGKHRRMLSLRATRMPGQPCPGVLVVLHDVSELRRLENLRREFVANVSHELKTPLASIKAYAETLRMGAIHDTEHNTMFVERIEEQADRLHQLILDLIHIARVESGKEVFEIVDVDLSTLIEACVLGLRDTAVAKQIELKTEGTEADVVARADEEGVETILNNLIGNAIKYTPERGSVVVRCRREGPTAIFEVEDTGIGIAPADQSRIFERFYRVDKARSREMGGTGLGLSIVKNLTQAFGGSISLESQLKKGSKFTVRLPAADGNGASAS